MMPSVRSILALKYPDKGAKSALLTTKSALKGGNVRRAHRHYNVRFKGVVSGTLHAVCTRLVEHCRSGTRTASLWEATCALLVAVDFFLTPLATVVDAWEDAYGHLAALEEGAELEHSGGDVRMGAARNIFFIVCALDVIFVLNAAFAMAQAMVWDLGFKDMPVDKIVDSAPGVVRTEVKQRSTIAEETLAALTSSAGALTWSGSKTRRTLYFDVSWQLLCMPPLWVAFALHVPPVVQACMHLLRLVRMRILLRYFGARQEDMAADVRWVAGCKFLIIIFSASHWLGCIFYYLAAHSGFSEKLYATNWISAWVEQTFVRFDWETSGPIFTYAVRAAPQRRCTARRRERRCPPDSWPTPTHVGRTPRFSARSSAASLLASSRRDRGGPNTAGAGSTAVCARGRPTGFGPIARLARSQNKRAAGGDAHAVHPVQGLFVTDQHGLRGRGAPALRRDADVAGRAERQGRARRVHPRHALPLPRQKGPRAGGEQGAHGGPRRLLRPARAAAVPARQDARVPALPAAALNGGRGPRGQGARSRPRATPYERRDRHRRRVRTRGRGSSARRLARSQMLPASLQARIAAEHCTTVILRNQNLLSGCDQQFLARFMTRLVEVYLMPGEAILKHGDIARELNFVVQGTLTVTDEQGVLVQLVSGEGTAPNVIGGVSFLMGARAPERERIYRAPASVSAPAPPGRRGHEAEITRPGTQQPPLPLPLPSQACQSRTRSRLARTKRHPCFRSPRRPSPRSWPTTRSRTTSS